MLLVVESINSSSNSAPPSQREGAHGALVLFLPDLISRLERGMPFLQAFQSFTSAQTAFGAALISTDSLGVHSLPGASPCKRDNLTAASAHEHPSVFMHCSLRWLDMRFDGTNVLWGPRSIASASHARQSRAGSACTGLASCAEDRAADPDHRGALGDRRFQGRRTCPSKVYPAATLLRVVAQFPHAPKARHAAARCPQSAFGDRHETAQMQPRQVPRPAASERAMSAGRPRSWSLRRSR